MIGGVSVGVAVVAIAAILVPGVIAGLKARWGWLTVGIVLRLLVASNPKVTGTTNPSVAYWLGANLPPELPWLIASSRLARPNSFWGRRYSDEKRARSVERFGEPGTPHGTAG